MSGRLVLHSGETLRLPVNDRVTTARNLAPARDV